MKNHKKRYTQNLRGMVQQNDNLKNKTLLLLLVKTVGKEQQNEKQYHSGVQLIAHLIVRRLAMTRVGGGPVEKEGALIEIFSN